MHAMNQRAESLFTAISQLASYLVMPQLLYIGVQSRQDALEDIFMALCRDSCHIIIHSFPGSLVITVTVMNCPSIVQTHSLCFYPS